MPGRGNPDTNRKVALVKCKHVGGVVMLTLITGLGCGLAGGRKTASSPKEVGEIMISSMKSGDWAGLYDLLGGKAKKDIDAQIDQLAANTNPMAREQTKKMMGFDPAELKGMPKREAFAKMTEGTMKFAEKMASAMGSKAKADITAGFAAMKVVDSKTKGDKGTVTIQDGKGKKNVLKVEKTADGWKLVTPPNMK